MSGPVYCMHCGTIGKPRSETPGSILIELILWCCLIVPGLIYSAWRINARRSVCRACDSRDIIPADSPRAIAARQRTP